MLCPTLAPHFFKLSPTHLQNTYCWMTELLAAAGAGGQFLLRAGQAGIKAINQLTL